MKPLLATALALPLVLALGACQQDSARSDVSDTPEDTCGAAALQSLVGQDRSALAGMEPGPKLRILEPGSVVTMDFRADRLNIELDEDGRVVRLYCA